MIAIILGLIFGLISLVGAVFTIAAVRLGWVIVLVKVVIDVVAGLGLFDVLLNGVITICALVGLGLLGAALTAVSAFFCNEFLD